MRWWGPLALLAAIRVAIPLAAYAGSSLPGTPSFTRSVRDGGLTGDATGFYAATREFMAAWGRMPRGLLVLAALVVLAVGVACALVWRPPWMLEADRGAWPPAARRWRRAARPAAARV